MPLRSSALAMLCLIASLLLGAVPGRAAEETFSADLVRELALPPDAKLQLISVATSKDEKFSDEAARKNAPDILALDACHVGGQRFLLKVTFARRPVFTNASFIIYIDLDADKTTGRQDAPEHRGVDLMLSARDTLLSTALHNPAFNDKEVYTAGAALDGNVLYVALDAPVQGRDGKVLMGLHLLSQRKDGRGDSTPPAVVQLPWFPERPAPKTARKGGIDLRPLSDYRYHDNLAKYEKLEDKGLTFEKVAPADPIQFGRPRPRVPFAASRKPGQAGAVARERVPVRLREEAGVARAAAISFGFPFPQGALFDLRNIRVLSSDEKEVPAQFTATSFWPDDSLKWVLIDFTAPLAAKQDADYAVEFGNDVRSSAGDSSRKIILEPDLTAVTGPLKVEGERIWFDADKDGRFGPDECVASLVAGGVRLVDEKGRSFTTAGSPGVVEENGPQKAVLRVEGPYANEGETYMRHVARAIFRAGSSRVTVVYTHINDYLKTEFTDITSLVVPIVPAAGIRKASVFLPREDGSLVSHAGLPLSLFQADELSASLRAGEAEIKAGRSPGLIRCETPRGVVTAVVHEFWQRWPKALSADAGELRIGLLPKQPDAEYGKGLPHYLLYPFVSGFYRFKWGMSFTTRMTFDFDPESRPEELLAEADSPVIAVIPPDWYAKTNALGAMAAPVGKQFAAWDAFVAKSYDAYLRNKERQREFGFFNYGDWYGERGRNWGNNEYDTAHGFFMQFARTGERGYFRLALAAARHQADVDCVHAYPDPRLVGGNHPHSIGHTGMWSERPSHGTWSARYDTMTSAANGHTWACGMIDAWHLAGDPRIMEAVIGLGEHIAWAMSPNFTQLGTHERSAGWSLQAIMAIYRSTYDPVYLDAAKRIAAVALREQKFDEGGAWPHLLPQDHAGGHPGARGNNLFLIGILLGGLQAYHEQTADPAVQKSLIAGANWVVKSWNENAEGWPYSASTAGEPFYKPGTGLNPLIIQPIAYVGHLTGDERFVTIAETAFAAAVRSGYSADGKSVAQKMHFTSGAMALLQKWYETRRPDKGVTVLDGKGAGMAEYLAKTPDAEEHSVRAPDEKVFYVRLNGPVAVLQADRRPHGAMTKRAESGTVRVLDASGAVVQQGAFDTDTKHRFSCSLKGAAGSVFKVVIQDDQRGVWSLAGEGLGIVAQAPPDFRIGAVGRGRFHFFVPAGTKEFRVKLLGVHSGFYAGVVLSPSNKIMGFHQGLNAGQALIPGAPKAQTPLPPDHSETGNIIVKPSAEDTGKMWSLVLAAAGDIGCDLTGVPPFLSLSAAAWFDPRDSRR